MQIVPCEPFGVILKRDHEFLIPNFAQTIYKSSIARYRGRYYGAYALASPKV